MVGGNCLAMLSLYISISISYFCLSAGVTPESPEALRLILGDLATRNAAIAREESVLAGDSERSDGPSQEGMRPVQVASGGRPARCHPTEGAAY